MSTLGVSSLIRRAPVTVTLDESIQSMAGMMRKEKFHHLLIVDYDRLVGVVSDRDILRRLSPWIGTVRETEEDLATMRLKAHQIMTREPIAINEKGDVFTAIEMILDENVSILPVVDDDMRPIGVISWKDILKQIIQHRQQRPPPARASA